MKKIRNSDKLVETIVGRGMSRWFSVKSRVASSGAPTFSLVYHSFRGGEIPLTIDMPLREVKADLQKFVETNSLTEFRYVAELVEELGGSVNGGKPRFYEPFLNSGCWEWCEKCHGLKKGRVVLSEGQYLLRPTEEGNRQYGSIAELCSCGGHEVEIVLGRYFVAEGLTCGWPHSGKPLVVRDNGNMADGQAREEYGQTGTLRELGLFASFAEAVEAATTRAS
ncbi:MAG: hypothetical protein AAB355_00780 [Patescibacteria group bacterium]